MENDDRPKQQAEGSGDLERRTPGTREGPTRQVLLFYGIGVIVLLLLGLFWYAAEALLLLFASILLAVLLNGASRRLGKRLRIGRGASLALVLVLMLGVLVGAGFLIAPRISAQVQELATTLPASIERLRVHFQEVEWLQSIMEKLPPPDQLVSNVGGMLTQVRGVFSGFFGAIANFAIVLFVGTYLAVQPSLYTSGLLTLLPQAKRRRGREVLNELDRTLELWLVGKLLSMLVIGITTTVGLALLGIPLAVVLGLIAGLLDFIPYLGPILAGVPAVLIAFSQEPITALYVVLLFIGVQVLEGYLLLPLVEKRTVSLPPALTITMQVMLGLPFGLLGVALATPLTAALAVLISMLYVQDVLGDPVKTPSEQ